MNDKNYVVAQQMLFIDREYFDWIMSKKMFFTFVDFPPRPTSIWGRLANLRVGRRQPSPNRFRVVVPLYKDQNRWYTRKRIVVQVVMVDDRMDIAYNSKNSYFGRPEPPKIT